MSSRLLRATEATAALLCSAGCLGTSISGHAGDGGRTSGGATSGLESTGTAGASSSGGTSVGTSNTGSGAGTSSGSASSGASSTGARVPYVGFDGGPHPEPPVDVGCDADVPFLVPGAGCVACTPSNDSLCRLQSMICDPLALKCVECTAALPCTAPALCDLDAGLCGLACVDGGCGPGFTCLGGQMCLPGCLSNGDCAADAPVCNLREALVGRCTTDCNQGLCPNGELCRFRSLNDFARTGTCLPRCPTGTGCPSGSYCRSDGLCADGCLTDRDCTSLEICQASQAGPGFCSGWDSDPSCQTNTGFPVSISGCTNFCSPSYQCPAGLQCDPGKSLCGCNRDADCSSLGGGTTPDCLDAGPSDAGIYGTCGCAGSSDCAAGTVCETRSSGFGEWLNPTGVCLRRCELDGGFDCGALVPAVCDPGTDYCSPWEEPAYPLCDPVSGQCVACRDNADCPPATPICLGAGTLLAYCSCASDDDCASGEVCGDGRCSPACTFDGGFDSCFASSFASPETCGPHLQSCPTTLCDTFTGRCLECLDDYDCQYTYPYKGVCRPEDGTCVECRNDADCKTGFDFCEGDAGVCGECHQASDCFAFGEAICTYSCTTSCTNDCGPGVACPAPLICASYQGSSTCSCTSDADCLVFDGGTTFTCVAVHGPIDVDGGILGNCR